MNLRKRVTAAICAIVLVMSITFQLNLIVSSSIITVPDDYPSIQEAIDAANEGDTVFVKAGQYDGNITIDKPLNLIGENQTTTIIDGAQAITIILVKANYVNISGFTIRNGLNNIVAVATAAKGDPAGGIGLRESIGCTITNNTIQGCVVGVTICRGAGNITISDNSIGRGDYSGISAFGVFSIKGAGGNTIANNNITFQDGVWIFRGGNNRITGNWIIYEQYGIQLGTSDLEPCGSNIVGDNIVEGGYRAEEGILVKASHDNIITNNTITAAGLYLKTCSNNTLRDNRVSSFKVEGSELPHFLHDIDTSNTVNGRPIYYLTNQSDRVIDPFNYPDVGYLGLVNSRNMSLTRLTIINGKQGLMLAQMTKSQIAEVHVSNSVEGMYLWNCSENTIIGNTVTSSGTGIDMMLCERNVIRGNTLLSNGIGIRLAGSSDNTFHRNNFMANGAQITREDELFNGWNDRDSPPGPYLCPICGKLRPVGNYWDDYAGEDDGSHTQPHNCQGDGIGDTLLQHQGVDSYPLMKPWIPVLGDLDYNGIVNLLDVYKLARNYGKTSP